MQEHFVMRSIIWMVNVYTRLVEGEVHDVNYEEEE